MINSTFEIGSTSATAWGIHSRRLKRAADVIFSHYSDAASKIIREETQAIDVSGSLELVMVPSLLYGLSLETMFKALIIQRMKPTLADLSGLFGQGSGHNLRALAQRANFAVSSDELDIMDRLTAFVEWAGRYPVAKKIEKMVVKQKAVRGEYLPLPLQLHEIPLFESFFSRADTLVFETKAA